MANSISSFGDTSTKERQQMSADPMNIVLADHIHNGHGAHNVVEQKRKRSKKKKIEVIKHPPPDWSKIRPEKAEKWIYSHEKEKWFTQQCKVKIDEVPFDKGLCVGDDALNHYHCDVQTECVVTHCRSVSNNQYPICNIRYVIRVCRTVYN